MKRILFLIILFTFINNFCTAQDDPYLQKVNNLIDYQIKLKEIHPALKNLYPVAVYKDSVFNIYEIDSSKNMYALVKKIPSTRYIIKGIRAAFPLEENNYTTTCVVTEDAFNSDRDYSVIFHEFVHCYQADTYEFEIKSGLAVYLSEIENNNYMWELNYPFPYDDEEINNLYALFIRSIENENLSEAERHHDLLKEKLSASDYQYLCWVEWKEGSARWIENLIRNEFNVDNNIAGKKGKFSRVSFYYGGSNYIKLLNEKYNTADLKELFDLIYN